MQTLGFCIVSLTSMAVVNAQQQPIDAAKSVMTVRVYKAGVFSALGHDHDIAAPIAAGTVDLGAHKVELQLNAAALKVRDAGESDKDRDKVQSTMAGPDVLDAEHHPQITFKSTEAEPLGNGSWRLHGELNLHGQTHAVAVEVAEKGGHYVGTSSFRQTEFGIKPVKIAGGAVRVKDQVRIEFDIQLAR